MPHPLDQIAALHDDEIVPAGIACRVLGVANPTLKEMERRGQLRPRFKLSGRNARYRLGDVRAFARGEAQRPAARPSGAADA